MVPASGASAPATIFSSVDFPAPLGPTSAILSPRYMVKSKPSYTVFSPKRFTRPRARTTSSPVRGGCLKLKCTVFFSSGSSMRLIFSNFFTRSCTCLDFVAL